MKMRKLRLRDTPRTKYKPGLQELPLQGWVPR